MTASSKRFERAKKVLAGGVNSPVRAFKAVGGDPVFARSGKGAVVTDADGKAYVDYCHSWGPLILGHAHPEVVAAAVKAARTGSSFGMPTERETELAELIRSAVPSMELLRLTSSGTEAVMSALRVARAFTKRDLVVKFAGCYHGHVDSLLVAAGSGATTLGRPDSAGVPEAWARTTITIPFNDPTAVADAFSKWGDQIAAVIVEPIVGNMGVVEPETGFLADLRQIASKHGALLIFDEVITGFRVGWGGAQGLFGIQPDLTTLGKIVGGGFPIGAYGGRRDVMELVAPLGPVYQAGTLSGNPVAVAAGLAALRALKRDKPYAALAKRTKRLAEAARAAAAKAGVPAIVPHAASMFTVFFAGIPVRDYAAARTADAAAYGRFFNALLKAGVYFPPAQYEAAFLSTAHTDRQLERTAAAFGPAFEAAR
ncbi:MAG: glutamate-1-semialdehyde 2,1-aminomutase [Elusimicrobia bacterium]|nr:glutamate-1-semialdehyde 2,1-aminomutase [Elusimicrobiota bacterium]